MRLEEDIKLDYKDVLIRPKRSTLGSRKEVNLNREFKFLNSKLAYKGVPIMAANMDGVGTFEMADVLATGEMFSCLVKTYSVEQLIEYFNSNISERTDYVAMSIGITDHDAAKFRDVYNEVGENLKYVCIDVANGYSERFGTFVKEFRQQYHNVVIIAGNVVTGEMTEQLLLNGADIVKVGIGPGSVCTTRIQTGVGYPQLSAVIKCADAAHGLGGHIIADGGCNCPGDVAKAFAGGADFVMLGGMLAGHNEGGGDIVTKYYKTGEWVKEEQQAAQGGPISVSWKDKIDRKQFIQFYGMSSSSANKKHFGGLKDYRASEGRTVLVPFRGSVADTVQEILGGIRSACTYAGAKTLKQLSKCTTFIRCTQTHNNVYENNTIGN